MKTNLNSDVKKILVGAAIGAATGAVVAGTEIIIRRVTEKIIKKRNGGKNG